MWRRLRWSVLAGGIALVGCSNGPSAQSQIVLSSQAATTTTATTQPASGSVPGSSVPGSSTPTVDQTWTPVAGNLAGLASECGNVGLGFLPDRDMLIAGITQHGLFAGSTASDEWTPLWDGKVFRNRLNQILVDPENSQTWWEAGIYGSDTEGPGVGVYRTDDDGATFQQLGDVEHIDTVSVDFSDPARQTLLAGKHETSTVLRSTDGGEHWEEVPNLPADIGNTSFPYVVDKDTYLVGSFAGTGSGIFRSTDAGQTWTKVFDKGVNGAPVVRDGTIQWLQDEGAAVLTSSDGGETWTSKTTGGFVSASSMIGLPDGRLASWRNTQLAVSADGGASWRFVGPAMPYTPNGLAWSPAGDTFYAYRWTCNPDDNTTTADSIIRLDTA